MIGFSYYDEPASNSGPSTQEMLAALSGAQKLAILDGFANKVPIRRLMFQQLIDPSVIRHLYGKIDAIEEASRILMNGDTPPATSSALLAAVQDDFSDDFTGGQVSAILSKMIECSKHDGTGDWNYYKAAVVA